MGDDPFGIELMLAAIRADPEAVNAYTAWMMGDDPTVLPIENATVREFLIADGVELKCASSSLSS